MSNKEQVKITYEVNQFVRTGWFKIWLIMAVDLFRSLGLGWRLFLRDFSSKYKQQLFGVFWVIITPGIVVVSYMLLAASSVLEIKSLTIPYPVYAFLGISIWGVVQGLIVTQSAVVNGAGSFISQINFPKEALLISPLLTTLLDFFIKLVLFLLVCFILHFPIIPLRMLYIFTLAPAILFGLGVGMFCSIIGAVFKDIGNMLVFIFQFLLLVTPIMYPLPEGSILGEIAHINPFFYLTVVPRDLVLFGQTKYLTGFCLVSLGSIIVFLLGWRFYKVAISRILEKI